VGRLVHPGGLEPPAF